MHVAVAIVGFRNPDDIERCLAALAVSTHADFEVIICENGGRRAFEAISSTTPRSLPGGQAVRIVEAPGNVGFAGGVNICLAETPDAEAWWVLNPDTQPQPGALGAKVAVLKGGACDAVGCTLYRSNHKVQSYGGVWRSWLARAESIGMGRDLSAPIDGASVVDRQNYLNGAAMLLGRRFVEAAGPMREDYFLYCEEVEWCLRAKAKGLTLGFAPGALVLHAQGTTTGAGADLAKAPPLPIFLSVRNAMLVTRDCYPGQIAVALPTMALRLLLRYGRAGAWAQLGYALRGLAAGLRNERGPPRWLTA